MCRLTVDLGGILQWWRSGSTNVLLTMCFRRERPEWRRRRRRHCKKNTDDTGKKYAQLYATKRTNALVVFVVCDNGPGDNRCDVKIARLITPLTKTRATHEHPLMPGACGASARQPCVAGIQMGF